MEALHTQQYHFEPDGPFLLATGKQQIFADGCLADAVITRRHHFICHKKTKASLRQNGAVVYGSGVRYTIRHGEIEFAQNNLLARHDLVVGRFGRAAVIGKHSALAGTTLLCELRANIISAQQEWLQYFLQEVWRHLISRVSSERDNLGNHQAIQLMLADVLTHIKTAQQALDIVLSENRDAQKAAQLLAMRELRFACHILARLYGGRAFLTGSIIEMIVVFEYFREVYFL